MDRRSIGSLEVLLGEVHRVRAQQQQHFDSLDGKAGILLGFAGALVALAPAGLRPITDLGRLLALMACFFALRTFWPRSFPTTNVFELREHYLSAEESFTKLALLDAQIDMALISRSIVDSKAGRLRRSMACLGLAALLTAVGVGLR